MRRREALLWPETTLLFGEGFWSDAVLPWGSSLCAALSLGVAACVDERDIRRACLLALGPDRRTEAAAVAAAKWPAALLAVAFAFLCVVASEYYRDARRGAERARRARAPVKY